MSQTCGGMFFPLVLTGMISTQVLKLVTCAQTVACAALELTAMLFSLPMLHNNEVIIALICFWS